MESPHMPNNKMNPPPIPRRPDDDKLQSLNRKQSNKLTNNPAHLPNSSNDNLKKYDPLVYRPRIHGKDGGLQRNLPPAQINMSNVTEQLLQNKTNPHLTNSNNNSNKSKSLERGMNGLSRSESVSSLDNLPDATKNKERRASTVHRMNTTKK